MKQLIIMLAGIMMMTAPPINAEIYVGGSLGYSNLNYDVESALWEKIGTDEELSQINGGLQALGTSFDVSSSTNSQYSKIFIGYNITRSFSFEAFYLNGLEYSLSAETNLSFAHQNNTIGFDGNISARANGIVNLQGFGVRVNGMLPLTKNLDLMAGLGLVQFKAKTTTNINIDSSYSYSAAIGINNQTVNDLINVSDLAVNGNNTNQQASQKFNDDTFISPVFAVGLLYSITDAFDVRSELEIYGLPINGMSISTLSIGGQYRF